MKIKRNKLDEIFSNVVREAYNWTCQCCGKESIKGVNGMMDAAHNFSRRHKFTRYDPRNVVCLCRSCHMRMTADPDEHVTFMKKHFGENYGLMRAIAKTGIDKLYASDIAAIEKHYKTVLEDMKSLRLMGEMKTLDIPVPDVLL